MDILLWINFFASMLPLPPPLFGVGNTPGSRCPQYKEIKSKGGLSVPNFKYYFWSFVLRPLSTWFNPEADATWKSIEVNLASPRRLEDLVYSISLWPSKRLGPVVSFLLLTWRNVVEEYKTTLNWHLNSPIFNKYSFLSEGIPFSSQT